jgi:phosphoglycolate phosphatase-like HAD superfamily hydrolase
MTEHCRRSVLLVDLDGTLTETAEGIVGCFPFALAVVERVPPLAADLTWIIGPPLWRSFAKLLGGGRSGGSARHLSNALLYARPS